jgi:hypothetical protein
MTASASNIRPIRPMSEAQYNRPTLDELVQLCKDFELISEISSVDGRFHIVCRDDRFTVSPSEAETLVRGLLIGYFAFHTRDDLSLADWLD